MKRARFRIRKTSHQLSRWPVRPASMATFLQAPLRSRTVGFPESGSDLGCLPIAFPVRGRLKRWLAYTLLAPVCGGPRRCFEGRVLLAQSPGPALRPPSAQSPFAWPTVLPPRQGRVLHGLGGHYPSVLAHTGSCARPNPSRLLRCLGGGSWQVAASPCWDVALPDVISAYVSLGAWTCVPGSPDGACAHSFPSGIGLPHLLTMGRRLRRSAQSSFVRMQVSSPWSFVTFRPPRLLATLTAPTVAALGYAAAVASTSGQNTSRYRPVHRIC